MIYAEPEIEKKVIQLHLMERRSMKSLAADYGAPARFKRKRQIIVHRTIVVTRVRSDADVQGYTHQRHAPDLSSLNHSGHSCSIGCGRAGLRTSVYRQGISQPAADFIPCTQISLLA